MGTKELLDELSQCGDLKEEKGKGKKAKNKGAWKKIQNYLISSNVMWNRGENRK